jgi:lysophospholipase L1-like esterase
VSLLALYTVLIFALFSTLLLRGDHEDILRERMFRPQFVLFGDSITQKSFQVGGWGAALTHAYQRKVDVVNRGFSGYNSRWALQLLDRIFPEDRAAGHILLATIFFGANDAALADRSS